MTKVGAYDAAVIGIPFDGGTTYRPGTRFGPQGVRKISALYTPYNYEMGVDLREQMTLCDVGDIFTIPANIEKTFDQITRAVSHVASSGALPIMIGGDHSIGFPCVRGIAQCTSKRIGIVHFDRHIDIQEKDLDERMHTTPWFHATDLVNVPPSIWFRSVSEAGRFRAKVWKLPGAEHQYLHHARCRGTGIGGNGRTGAGTGMEGRRCSLYLVRYRQCRLRVRAGTGWPEPGGFLPREALELVSLVAKEGICGLEVVEVSPPYDCSDITALLATRVIVDVLGTLVSHGKMGSHKSIIDKPVSIPAGPDVE